MSAATPTGCRRLPRKVCIILIAVIAPLLLYLEFGKPTLSEDAVLQSFLSMSATRLLGAVVFFALLLSEGYRVQNPVQKPFWRGLLFSLPAILVVVNNLPLLGLLWGDVTVVHNTPTHWLLYSLQCLAIGLFEEFAFRGVIFLGFAERRRTRKGLLVSILLTSAVFGLVHLVNLVGNPGAIGAVLMQIGYSFLIGAMCSVVLLRTRNIWLCVLLHAVFDFGGKLVGSLSLATGNQWNTPTIIITAALAVATTVYFVWQFFRLDLGRVDEIYEV